MLWLLILFLLGSALVLLIPLARRPAPRGHGGPRSSRGGEDSPTSRRCFHPPKPLWVRREVLHLNAWLPQAGCRTLTLTFNHLHGQRRGMTVGKTYVAGVLRESGEEVIRVRRKLRWRKPRQFARNVMWGLDWTFVPGVDGGPQAVLGVIDYGSRACVELEPVRSRKTVTVLRQLLQIFERFGTPKVVRTDNDPAFRSLLFRGRIKAWTG